MVSPINWKMISHPMNWVVILLMLIIAGAFGHLLLSYMGIEPAKPVSSAPTSGLSGNLDPNQPTV